MEKNEKIGLQKMCKRYYNTCKRLHKVARNCVKEKVRNIMERVIKLPDAEAIKEFVKCSRKSNKYINVSKQNFNYQVDAASILGMMTLLGTTIIVEYADSTDELNYVLSKYAV